MLFPGLAPFYGRLAPASYAALRIAYGLTMFTHGLPKLLNEGHGSMANPLAASVNLIGQLGLPFASQFAGFVTLSKRLGTGRRDRRADAAGRADARVGNGGDCPPARADLAVG